MPASRRTSASSHDEELAGHLQGLSLAGERSHRVSPAPATASILKNGRFGDDDGVHYGNIYNAGMMLDEQLDQEMHSAFHVTRFHLPILAGLVFRCYEKLAYIGR